MIHLIVEKIYHRIGRKQGLLSNKNELWQSYKNNLVCLKALCISQKNDKMQLFYDILTKNIVGFEFARVARLKNRMGRSLLMPALQQLYTHKLCGYKTLALAATLCLECNKIEKVAWTWTRQLCSQEHVPQWSITCQCQALPVLKWQVRTRWVSALGLGRGRCLCGWQPCPEKYMKFKLYSNDKYTFLPC